MNTRAPLFEDTGDANADQLVANLTKACDFLIDQNQQLLKQQQQLQDALNLTRKLEIQTRQKIETLVQRLKILEQEA